MGTPVPVGGPCATLAISPPRASRKTLVTHTDSPGHQVHPVHAPTGAGCSRVCVISGCGSEEFPEGLAFDSVD